MNAYFFLFLYLFLIESSNEEIRKERIFFSFSLLLPFFFSSSKSKTNKNMKRKSTYLGPHNHIVLLVLENRSFDSFYGFLPLPGINGLNHQPNLECQVHPSTKAPESIQKHKFKPRIVTHPYSPRIDPNEEYPDLYECFTGKEWSFGCKQISELRELSKTLPMNGFATNYYRAIQKQTKNQPSVEQIQQIMDVLAPQTIPVFSHLATQFSLFDNYFCDVPSCTLPNRCFLQSASSAGNVTNQNYIGIQSWLRNPGITLYDHLNQGKISWKVYYDIHNVLPTSFLINFPHTHPYKNQFVSMDIFFHDLTHSSLPQFSLLEPQFFSFANDAHPQDSDSFPNHNSLSRLGTICVANLFCNSRQYIQRQGLVSNYL